MRSYLNQFELLLLRFPVLLHTVPHVGDLLLRLLVVASSLDQLTSSHLYTILPVDVFVVEFVCVYIQTALIML